MGKHENKRGEREIYGYERERRKRKNVEIIRCEINFRIKAQIEC